MKHLTLLSLLLLCATPLLGRQISLQEASHLAEAFWATPHTRAVAGGVRLAWDSGQLSTSASGPLYYVFEPQAQSQGFVIVAGDSRATPILAYSHTARIAEPHAIPPAMAAWLHWRAEEIARLRTGAPATLTRGGEGQEVVLSTAQWAQDEPYNAQCPMWADKRCIVGCTPVATAIAMRYHQWPAQGRGLTEAYTTPSLGIAVEARSLDHTYDWGEMPLSFDHGYTPYQAQQVSTLMADLGAAFEADYTPFSTSSAPNTIALHHFFDFHPSVWADFRASYPDSTWLRLLREEIDACRPVVYIGESATGGHTFLLDGYSGDNYFHVNWGWNQFNGFFLLSALTPAAGRDYTQNHYAVFSLRPNHGEPLEHWIRFASPGIQVEGEVPMSGGQFVFSLLRFHNRTARDFHGAFRGALVDAQGGLKEWITPLLRYNLPARYSVSWKGLKGTLTQPVEEGESLCFFYQPEGEDEWQLIHSSMQANTQWQLIPGQPSAIAAPRAHSATPAYTLDGRPAASHTHGIVVEHGRKVLKK